jgi:hypothetical protein
MDFKIQINYLYELSYEFYKQLFQLCIEDLKTLKELIFTLFLCKTL